MAVPAAYTEQQLIDFMHESLSDTAKTLGMTSPASYREPLNDALLAYGETNIASITGNENLVRLRALARLAAWKAALARASSRYDISDGQQALKRSQILPGIKEAIATAERDAAAAGAVPAGYAVVVQKVKRPHDPYTYLPDDQRVP